MCCWFARPVHVGSNNAFRRFVVVGGGGSPVGLLVVGRAGRVVVAHYNRRGSLLVVAICRLQITGCHSVQLPG